MVSLLGVQREEKLIWFQIPFRYLRGCMDSATEVIYKLSY